MRKKIIRFDLFNIDDKHIDIAENATLLPKFAFDIAPQILKGVKQVGLISPFRQMITPQGKLMSVLMTNCGKFGWVSDKYGYKYTTIDPLTGLKWPKMPDIFLDIAKFSAIAAGFNDFIPDVCLINQYSVGSKLSLHKDSDEKNFNHPIVSISLGVPARFLFGGKSRKDDTKQISLEHGDVVVWGGKSRLNYHGILPIISDYHPDTGSNRINLTFRKAI